MANYKESTLPCTSYVRASGLTCSNPRDGAKMIQFQEETVLMLPDGSVASSPAGQCTKFLTPENAATAFVLRDPVTGEATNKTMTYQDAYTVLMSLYYHVAEERDLAAGA